MRSLISLQKQFETESRIIEEAHWYLDNKTSIRDVAANFMVGKSTVHKDFRNKLKYIDYDLYREVDHLLNFNKKNAINRMNEAHKHYKYTKG